MTSCLITRNGIGCMIGQVINAKHFIMALEQIGCIYQMTNRDYKKEYGEYHIRPKQKLDRAGRNKARLAALKKVKLKRVVLMTYITRI